MAVPRYACDARSITSQRTVCCLCSGTLRNPHDWRVRSRLGLPARSIAMVLGASRQRPGLWVFKGENFRSPPFALCQPAYKLFFPSRCHLAYSPVTHAIHQVFTLPCQIPELAVPQKPRPPRPAPTITRSSNQGLRRPHQGPCTKALATSRTTLHRHFGN